MKKIFLLFACLFASLSLMAGQLCNPNETNSAQDDETIVILIDDGSSDQCFIIINPQGFSTYRIPLNASGLVEDDFNSESLIFDFSDLEGFTLRGETVMIKGDFSDPRKKDTRDNRRY